MTEREIVEQWLSELCKKLDCMVLSDHEFWPVDFQELVEIAYQYELIDQIGTGFFYYTPTDEDVLELYPIARNEIMSEMQPETEEEIDAYLRSQGLDPDEIVKSLRKTIDRAMMGSPLNPLNHGDKRAGENRYNWYQALNNSGETDE